MTEILTVPDVSGLPDWIRAYGSPPLQSADLKQSPDDFVVIEQPVCLPDGAGEHVWLYIRKRMRNTQDVAKVIARWAGVKVRDVSYAGLKDRWALTEQWFSVQLPGKETPELGSGWPDGVEVLELHRHSRKLRRGALTGNRFQITLRRCVGDQEAVQQRIDLISSEGLPNYFGEQRFGQGGGNLDQAKKLLLERKRIRDRGLESIILSAARSYLFNLVLQARLEQQSWMTPQAGDLVMLDGSRSTFPVDGNQEDLVKRLASADVHLTGPLPGRGTDQLEISDIEKAVLAEYTDWVSGLARLRVDADRRALRVMPKALTSKWLNDSDLRLEFSLPAGSYATAVLREIADYHTVDPHRK